MKKYFSLAATLIVSMWIVTPALAGECESDTDCAAGFECKESEVGKGETTERAPGELPTEQTPTDEKGSEDDDDSSAKDGELPRQDESWGWCEPRSCEADADCDGGTVCNITTYENCWGGTKGDPTMEESTPIPSEQPDAKEGDDPKEEGEDDSAEEGKEMEEPECETVTFGLCGPKWLGSCETATDCGPAGFDCIEEEVCWGEASTGSAASSGSAGSAGFVPSDTPEGKDSSEDTDEEEASEPVDTEDAEEDKEDKGGWEETCEPTGKMYCDVQKIECSTDADCPADFTCEAMFESVSLSPPCTIDEDGNEDCPEVEIEEPEVTSYCLPAGYFDYVGWGGGAGVAESGLGENANTGTNDDGTNEEAAPADPGGDGNATGPSDQESDDSTPSSSSDDGCLGGPNPMGLGWTALALMALALGRRRPAQR